MAAAFQRTATAFHAQPSGRALGTPAESRCPSRRDRGVSPRRTALPMVAKSGGRLIFSTEQFEREVLQSGAPEPADGGDPVDDGGKGSLPVLVLFSAPWCGPCRLTIPVVKEVMKQYHEKIEVVEISTDDLPEVASQAGVLSIPTILIYHRGAVMDTIVGCVAKNVLARSVDKVLEDLGMLDEDKS